MAKTRAEINRQNYLRNKQKRILEAKTRYKNNADQIKAKAKSKYEADYGTQYITVKNIPMHKQIGEFLIKYLNSHVYFDNIKYNNFIKKKGFRTPEQLKFMLEQKHRFNFTLSDMQKNNLLLAASYRYYRIKNSEKSVVISNETTRDHSNEISNGHLRYLDGITSNTKESEVRRLDGYAFFDVEYLNKLVGGKLVKMKSFKLIDNNPIKDQQMFLDLKMTNKSFTAWNLYTKGQLSNLIDDLILNDLYYQWRNQKLIKDVTKFDTNYQGVENNFENYHTVRTVNEQLNKNRMLSLRVSNNFRDELTKISDNKNVVDYQQINDLSRAVKTLLGTNITFSHGRMYFKPFTHLKKYYRKYLTLNNKPIKEVFDIPNCHSVMSLVFFARSNYRDEKELNDLKKIIIYGSSIYNWIMDKLGIENVGDIRDQIVKPNYNHWMFMPRYGKKNSNGFLRDIDRLIKQQFPNYYQFLYNQKEIEVMEFGKKMMKCQLPVKSEWLENEIVINGLFNLVKDKDSVVLHDAIYITEDQYTEELKNQLKEQFFKIIEQKLKGDKE